MSLVLFGQRTYMLLLMFGSLGPHFRLKPGMKQTYTAPHLHLCTPGHKWGALPSCERMWLQ